MTSDPSSRKLRILYLIDYWGLPAGTEKHLVSLLQSLDARKFECRVVVFNYIRNALAEQAKENGIDIVHIPVAEIYTSNALRRGMELRRYMRRHRIDIVHTFHFKSDVYGAVVAFLAGVPKTIASKRDAAEFKMPVHFRLHRLVRPLIDHYIAVSGVVARVIHEREHVPYQRMSVIHNGVDLDQYSFTTAADRNQAKAALGLSPGQIVVGMSAWFRLEKDHSLLVNAFRAVIARHPSARLLLIGGGPLLEQYSKQISASNLAPHVIFAGGVHDVRPHLRALDIACLVPATNEGFSNSVLEKMALGLPLVVTDVGGNAEAVADGQSGFVIPPRDQAALESRLIQLIEDPALRLQMGGAARDRAEKLFSMDRMISQHQALYESLMPDSLRSGA